MKNSLDSKITLWLGLFVFVATLVLKNPSTLGQIYDAMATTVFLVIGARWLFVRWLWKKIHCLFSLHGIPNLEGRWNGTFKSNWIPTPESQPAEDDVEVIITQPNIFEIKITQKTKESCSHSFCESFEKLEDGTMVLNYSYINTPNANLRARSPVNFGTARYELENDMVTLKGNYWTDRQSTGTISLKKKS